MRAPSRVDLPQPVLPIDIKMSLHSPSLSYSNALCKMSTSVSSVEFIWLMSSIVYLVSLGFCTLLTFATSATYDGRKLLRNMKIYLLVLNTLFPCPSFAKD